VPAATPVPRGPSVLTLYSAEDLLTTPGCPVCRYVGEASDRYLGWFALQAHAEIGTITRLCAALGMCARHTRELMRQPGAATRLTAVYRYVVVEARDRLAGQSTQVAVCPACEHDDAAADRALDTLLDGLADAQVRDRCRELGGLCILHLRAAFAKGPRKIAAWLAETFTATLHARPPGLEWLAGGIDHDTHVRAVLREAIPARAERRSYVCAACLAGAHSERHHLKQLPGVGIGDNGRDPELLLCSGHLSDVAAAAGHGDGTRALLAWQAECLIAGLSRRSPSWAGRSSGNQVTRLRRGGRQAHMPADCTVCRTRDRAVRQTLDDVRVGLRSASKADDDRRVALCVRHVLSLRAAERSVGQAAARGAVDHADWLIAELTEAFRKNTWEHRAETRGPEMSAWRRAAAFLDGGVFGACPPGHV
jgi:hypothetical protein